ncbi:bifunctional folylpolyglutamate synthase/dihydrofolate synthase [Plectonema cf. radiosum LEGE 06105]|uniref:tetrahydrofolate synthase n=1 Tax=Plectonema cf. radiosum LEGE 06105 TaxID=945769 RepID=A0A8J7F6S2_9CYAN|nr:folylpolyglutamate synthase/dihydrofolate synthase family protein [Plectonema radiosum]MBE9216465.1 bifunctional folylpolyglutamate synthase/dihydrofolate synthase [Plectonema cf. radiosum LEGE 06105]
MDIDSLLQPYKRFGVHLGLERIYKLLANLGNPHHRVAVVHVAGTNGKGSVCAYLSSVFTEAGYRTGRYTSPHLVDWTERICFNEQQVTTEELGNLLLQIQEAIDPEEESPTQFEVFTAAAWLYFAQKQVDVAVVEVGLGGRLDATNVCEKPLVTIITSISRDHCQQLGSTIAAIATEKAGILKSGCPVVMGELPPEAELVVCDRASLLQCPIIKPQPAREVGNGWVEVETATKPIKYLLPLQGNIQLNNSALAIAVVKILQEQGWQISEKAIVEGIAKTKWLGRMQWTSWNNHKLLLDGAHNPAAAEALRNYVDTLVAQLNQPQVSVTWVMGMLSTKEHDQIFKTLLRGSDQLHLVPVPDHSSAVPSELRKLALSICPELNSCNTYADLSSALSTVFKTNNNLVVLCGSLYLVGNFLQNSSVMGNG